MFHPQGPTFYELAVQALSSTEQGYDSLAPKFDYTPFRTPNEMLQRVRPIIGDDAAIDAALDVCCGTGAAMQMLRPLCARRVVGVDFSLPMIAQARRNLQNAEGAAELDFVRANVLEMPFQPRFDLAVCFGALGHILPKHEEPFLKQVARSLRPGGRFVFATAHMPPLTSMRYWMSRGFNAAMHVRNLFVRPPFVMYYLTFLLPRAEQLLLEAGFEVAIHENVFPAPFREACLVVGTKER